MTGSMILIPAALVLAVVLAACGTTDAKPPASGAPAVDEGTAISIAENAFAGLNSGDYETWTRDWSQTMKDAIKEADFLAFRDALLAAKGRYVAIESVAYSAPNRGSYRYTFEVSFEKASGTFWFGFIDGRTSVEGVSLEK